MRSGTSKTMKYSVGNDGQTLRWLVVHAQRGRLVDYLLKVRSSSTTTGGEETHVHQLNNVCHRGSSYNYYEVLRWRTEPWREANGHCAATSLPRSRGTTLEVLLGRLLTTPNNGALRMREVTVPRVVRSERMEFCSRRKCPMSKTRHCGALETLSGP